MKHNEKSEKERQELERVLNEIAYSDTCSEDSMSHKLKVERLCDLRQPIYDASFHRLRPLRQHSDDIKKVER